MSAQAPADRPTGGKAGVTAGPRRQGGHAGWRIGPGLQPQLCLSWVGPVALGRRPTLSDLQFPMCTAKLLDNMVCTQDTASEPHSGLKGASVRKFPQEP